MYLTLIEEIAEKLCSITDIHAASTQVLETLIQGLKMTRGTIALLHPQSKEIYTEFAYGLNSQEQSRGHYQIGEGITGLAIQSGKNIVVPDVSKEPLFLNKTRSRNLQKEKIAFFCIPVQYKDQVIGSLSVETKSTQLLKAQDIKIYTQVLVIIASLLAPLLKEKQESLLQSKKEQQLKKQNTYAQAFQMIGNSPAIQVVYAQIAQVASSNSIVLLRGESGTGKELVARAIHNNSTRYNNNFVSLNCAAIPETLIESELFGHEKGAFTNAHIGRKGRFEQAQKGTLFLDEIGDISLQTQAKLLRVLQEHTFEPLGSTKTIHADVRIIAATHQNLEEMVEKGTFRKDLYYRLNVFPIFLPPLRERKNDILLLAEYFIEIYGKNNNNHQIKLSLSAMDMLQKYTWEGNIRELENTIERAILLVGKDKLILPQHLPLGMHSKTCPTCGIFDKTLYRNCSLEDRIRELEQSSIISALEQHKGHIGHAAKELGLTERMMTSRMKKYSISYQDYRI